MLFNKCKNNELKKHYFISDLSLETSLSLLLLEMANFSRSDFVILFNSLFSFSIVL